jgi:hypothetical protein
MQNNSVETIMSIPRATVEALIRDSGLPTEAKKGWTKVLAADGSDRRVYVPTTRLVKRIDLAGFVPPPHVAIKLLDEARRRISGGVHAQIDFSRPMGEVVDAIRFALEIVAGTIAVELVVPRSRAAMQPSLALVNFAEPAEYGPALRFFHQVAVAALAAASTEPTVDKHLNYVLDKCIWGVTTCSDLHKYNTRYLSVRVRDLVLEWSASAATRRAFSRSGFAQQNVELFKKLVRHEHVVTRKALRSALRAAEPQDIEQLLRGATACLVTIEEARALDGQLASSWDRYRAAEIAVWDRTAGDWLAI